MSSSDWSAWESHCHKRTHTLMNPIPEESLLQADLTGRGTGQESGNVAGAANGVKGDTPREDTRKRDDAISRSLMSGHLETDEDMDNSGAGAKRPSTNPLSHSRLKKKRTVQQSAAETQTSALLQSLVPKMGPTFRMKPEDSEQRHKAIEGIQSGHQQSIEAGLNFFMAWSLVEKSTSSSREAVDVISVLVDFIMGVVTSRPMSAREQIGEIVDVYVQQSSCDVECFIEEAQYTSLMPDEIQQCMAAGLILKNLSLSLGATLELVDINEKITHFLISILQKKVQSWTATGEMLLRECSEGASG